MQRVLVWALNRHGSRTCWPVTGAAWGACLGALSYLDRATDSDFPQFCVGWAVFLPSWSVNLVVIGTLQVTQCKPLGFFAYVFSRACVSTFKLCDYSFITACVIISHCVVSVGIKVGSWGNHRNWSLKRWVLKGTPLSRTLAPITRVIEIIGAGNLRVINWREVLWP